MCAHLPAVNRIFLTHPLFNERMPGLRHHRRAAAAGHHIHRIPRQTRVVDNPGARLLLQERFRQQANNIIAFDKFCIVIKHKAAVEVTVKGDTHVRAVLAHRIRGVLPALRQQRVRDTVREVADRLVMHLDKGHRHACRHKTFLHFINHVTGCAVAGVHHQLQRTGEAGQVHVAHKVIHVLLQHRYLSQGAATGRIHRRKLILFRQALDIAQPGVAADGLRVFTHQFHAVVVHRVMAGRHLYPAVHAQVEGGEVNLFGPAQTNIQHVRSRIHQASGQRQLQRLAGQTHIATHHDRFRLQKFTVGASDTVGDIFV